MSSPTLLLSGRPRGRIFRRYVTIFVAVVWGVLLASSLVAMYFGYQDSRRGIFLIQQEKAQAAALKIEQFAKEIEGQLWWAANAPWTATKEGLEQRRLDFLKLQRRVPAITELSQLDEAGREQLRISRVEVDVVGSRVNRSRDPKFTEARTGKTYFGPVYFRSDSEPYMSIAMAGVDPERGVTVAVAEVNLKFVWDVVSLIRIGRAGQAYVVDRQGTLVAHPEIGLVLKKTSLKGLPQVESALASPSREGGAAESGFGKDLTGRRTLSSHVPIAFLQWTVFAEQPLGEAFEPLYAVIYRTLGLLLAGLVFSVVASLLLAQRMVRPIQALQSGAARIASGVLDHRVDVKTGDELEALADQFNNMASQLQESYAHLERRVDDRTRELSEALEQQTATSEVLKVISRSTFDLQPVLDTLIVNATKLCGAKAGCIVRFDGEFLPLVAAHNLPPEFIEHVRQHPVRPGRENVTARAALERRTVHVPDILEDPEYRYPTHELTGVRSLLGVPMLREGVLIGVIWIGRKEARAFTDRQIDLVTTFADQAVIAIENVRLFQEVQVRNGELSQALDRETATGEILRVISSSPTSVEPVFEAILASGLRLCESDVGLLFLVEGDESRLVSSRGAPAEFTEPARAGQRLGGPHLGLTRAVRERRPVHIVDMLADRAYTEGDPSRLRSVKLLGARTGVWVPLLKDGAAIGVLVTWRRQVRAFTEVQIDVLTTFANQAVIALENVRLFEALQDRNRELTEALEQQTATSEVLKLISRSTFDLQPVLDTLIENATRLCGAEIGEMLRFDGEFCRPVAGHNIPPALKEYSERNPIRPGRETVAGRAALERRAVHIPDILADPEYQFPAYELGGVRSMLGVPMLREGALIGVIVIWQKEVRRFTDRQIELVTTFADQAVIAIENVRLFNEIQEKSRQLELASQHKSQFLANMSHELRTPLNAILGYTELIQDHIYGEVPEKIREVLDRVQHGGRHLLGLINDVLDLSKIEAGQLILTLSDYSLNDVVQTVVTATESLAAEKRLALKPSVPTDLPVGRGDERRLAQVLMNLVGNALKFTEVGEVRIDATAFNGEFRVSVTDTGPGIAETDQARIFEEFQQVDSSITREKGGTGLGLAIARRIVELHGGHIGVESSPSRGSTFWFTVPVRVDRQTEAS